MIPKVAAGVVLTCALWLCPFTFQTTLSDFPFRNKSLPYSTRVEDLVNRLTVDEMLVFMSRGGGNGKESPPVERLGIPAYWWGTECIHGDIRGQSTAFPQSIGLAAAFSPDLIHRVAEAVSVEVRARNNYFVKHGVYETHTGLNCFSPVINIMRHPLWGRNQETYGEDPYLSGVYAAHFVLGLKGDHPRYYRANAVCKHFDAYGGPEDLPRSRLGFNAVVSERDLRLTFLPQFQACVEAGALGVMCSYNSINGVPSCVSKYLLTDLLRTEWKFPGFVISDAGAIEFILLWHRYLTNIEETAAACVNAGLNLELSPGYARNVFDWLDQALTDGKISKETVIERIKPLMYTRMRLGEFDPKEDNPYLKLNLSVVQSKEHRELATLAAAKSFVLLKNNNLLPISKHLNRIAVVGPFAYNAGQQFGNYAPDIDLNYTTTPATGLSPLADHVTVAAGCDNNKCLWYNKSSIIQAVKTADVTFVCLGTGIEIETENFDRDDMLLPGNQKTLLQDVIETAPGQVVLLLFSAGPLDIRAAVTSPKVGAIIHCFFPAQATGAALFNVITQRSVSDNPAGRLPFTWYYSQDQIPSMTNYSMVNRTYRYFDGEPLFPFGYGLSYTEFKYSNLTLNPQTVKAGNDVTATFTLTNTGPVDGDEVYQGYISWKNATVPMPLYQLVTFNRTMVAKGQTTSVSFVITSHQMAVWIDGKGFIDEPGEIVVYVGGQMPNQKSKVPSNVIQGSFFIV